MWAFVAVLVSLVLLSVAVFLIVLILIQRGKGGGLTGALGGSPGTGPFGARAGDQFTRLTIYVFIVWLFLTMFLVKVMQLAP